jgi:hypothetical protein
VVAGILAASFGVRGYLVTRNYERMFFRKVSGIISDLSPM